MSKYYSDEDVPILRVALDREADECLENLRRNADDYSLSREEVFVYARQFVRAFELWEGTREVVERD